MLIISFQDEDYHLMEKTEITDPKTGKVIAISTTARLVWREAWPAEYADMRNARLNIEIAKDFASSSGNVVHYFNLGSKDSGGSPHKGTAEIRAGGSSFYYISAIRSTTIDIISIQADWLKPKYKGSRDNPMELGDE